MLKKIINRVKILVDQNKDNGEYVDVKKNDEIIVKNEEIIIDSSIDNIDQSIEINDTESIDEEGIVETKEDELHLDSNKINCELSVVEEVVLNDEVAITIEYEDDKIIDSYEINNDKDLKIIEELTKEDLEYIKEIKIKRGKSIRAIDVYTKEIKIFNTYKECSKKLKIPVEYIQENLKYGYTDYLGEAIKYLAKELDEVEYLNYLENTKTPSQILTYLNSKIFTKKMCEEKRDEILCSEKLEPVKMYYTFECIDEEYDDYFRKYKSIIKRGGKKKIELIDKNGEAIEIFKSLDECATFLNKEKNKIVDMLKYKDTKVGRYEIRYSLRNI